MIRLVIFDLDGTLLDTIDDLAMATNHALRMCGYPVHEIGAYRFFAGNGINKLFERALPEAERRPENIVRIRKLFLPYYGEHNADLTVPYPGILEVLQHLQRSGVSMAVASNKYQEATERLIGHYFPRIDFVRVLGQREGIAVKPDPAIVFDILESAGVRPEEALFVGDSGVDMQTALRSGLCSVGVTWGFRPKEELLSEGARNVVDHPSELLTLIG